MGIFSAILAMLLLIPCLREPQHTISAIRGPRGPGVMSGHLDTGTRGSSWLTDLIL